MLSIFKNYLFEPRIAFIIFIVFIIIYLIFLDEEGAFKKSGTGIKTYMVVIDKV